MILPCYTWIVYLNNKSIYCFTHYHRISPFLYLLIWMQENFIIPWPATIITIDESCWCGGGGVANSQQQPDYFNVLYRTALCVADPSAGWALGGRGSAWWRAGPGLVFRVTTDWAQ